MFTITVISLFSCKHLKPFLLCKNILRNEYYKRSFFTAFYSPYSDIYTLEIYALSIS